MKRVLASVVCLLLALHSFCMSAEPSPAPKSQSGSGLEGVIDISPTHPGPVRADVPSSKPLAKIDFVVSQDDRIITSFSTDDEGRFHISLPPGHYKISSKEKRPRIGGYGPWEIDVAPGKMTTVDWHCDTGMR